MQYREIKALNLEEAKYSIMKEYGDRARIIKTVQMAEGGILGFGRKKYVKVLISITENELLETYKKNLGISRIPPKKEMPLAEKQNKLVTREESLSLSLLMEKINSIEKVIKKNNYEKTEEIPPNLMEIKEILKDNEFYDDFINDIINDILNNLPVAKIENRLELHGYVYDYIKGKLKINETFKFENDKKRVMVIVGPTGVGKTTTVTKIAAAGIRDKVNVELITIDGYRIGAKFQLEKYAEIMNTPMCSVEDKLELQKVVALSDAELIVIDTIGRSQTDDLNIVKMKQMLDLKNIEVDFVLAISAATKPREVEKIFKSFDIFDYKSIIITKLDESGYVGAIISSSISKNKEILFFTNGQRVPNDIERATGFNIMSKIKGLEPEVIFMNSKY
jgi:flagellar biosynthesis protein FlhF